MARASAPPTLMLLTMSTTCPSRFLSRAGAGVVLGQHVLERGVVPLDGGHGVVHCPPYGGLARLGLQLRPPGLWRHPEDVLGDVLVPVLGGFFTPFGEHLGVALLEGIGDVLEEDEAEDDVLVLGGVHAAPQGVRHAPQIRPVVPVDELGLWSSTLRCVHPESTSLDWL